MTKIDQEIADLKTAVSALLGILADEHAARIKAEKANKGVHIMGGNSMRDLAKAYPSVLKIQELLDK